MKTPGRTATALSASCAPQFKQIPGGNKHARNFVAKGTARWLHLGQAYIDAWRYDLTGDRRAGESLPARVRFNAWLAVGGFKEGSQNGLWQLLITMFK